MTFLTIPNKGNYIFVFKKKKVKVSPFTHRKRPIPNLHWTDVMCHLLYIYHLALTWQLLLEIDLIPIFQTVKVRLRKPTNLLQVYLTSKGKSRIQIQLYLSPKHTFSSTQLYLIASQKVIYFIPEAWSPL